ncbi:hypothetical protein [Treponema sp.]|uniref:hypothetical protein n=1 Tax=Treponema sp. TaxID=166 RepID=UPI00298E59FE|nr:hypothetical protein [Treponema sp.]MCQ2242462.1 hypothetical protein [Treponema sp.]
MMSCQTTVKTVYVVPEIDIPDFPNPKGFTSYDEKTDEVRMPLNYYEQIMKFKLKVQEAKKVYNAAKELYEGGNDCN